MWGTLRSSIAAATAALIAAPAASPGTAAAAASVSLQLAGGWSHWGSGFSPAAASKAGDVVTLTGVLRGSGHGRVATLPPGLRPPARLVFALNNEHLTARVDVLPDGAIQWVKGGGTGWIALDGITFSVTPGQRLPLAAGWQDFGGGYGPLEAKRAGDLIVLSGLVRAPAARGPIATLPAGLRPPEALIFNAGNDDRIARVDVSPDGQIRWDDGGPIDPASPARWLSLSGITFSARAGRPLPLAAGWQSYGGFAPARVIEIDGRVVVSGLIRGAAKGLLATLPPELRPAAGMIFHVNNADLPVRVDAGADGALRWTNGGRPDSWISLSGITFASRAAAPAAQTEARVQGTLRIIAMPSFAADVAAMKRRSPTEQMRWRGRWLSKQAVHANDAPNSDKLLSTRFDPRDLFQHYIFEPQPDGSHRIRVRATGSYLHANDNGDRLVSTRFQSNDDFARFVVEDWSETFRGELAGLGGNMFPSDADARRDVPRPLYKIRVKASRRYLTLVDRLLRTTESAVSAVPVSLQAIHDCRRDVIRWDQASRSNAARGKPVQQSSTSVGGRDEATFAIDGDVCGTFAQTEINGPRGPSWWEVDLGRPHAIEAILIWAGNAVLDGALVAMSEAKSGDALMVERDGVFRQRISGAAPLNVVDGRRAGEQRMKLPMGGSVAVKTPPQPARARYIRIYHPRRDRTISLSEVFVVAD